MLDVCLLGTGGMMPLPGRWLTALLLRCGGSMILADCGEGTQIPLRMAGWGMKQIDAILFTHYHADHTAGLPGLLLSLGNSGKEEPLALIGPPGIKAVVEGLAVVCPQLPYDVLLYELPHDLTAEISIHDIHIKSMPADHNIPCLSYSFELKRPGKFNPELAKQLNIPIGYWKKLQKGEIIEAEGRVFKPDMVMGEPRKGIKVCYCTDTRPTEGLARFAAGSDLFVCEGMYGDNADSEKAVEKKHMTFSEAAALAGRGDVKELWLTHYSPSLTEPEAFLENATAIFRNTVAGRDLLTRTIRYDK